ncbi:MAG: biotin--[acetyl-CoA-carboxylase] ligase, partial [Actinomycetia bacterium]|nr:biotin--[acetyl-CoA-carboxylase] ligase [Actinomycetes bacterium]
MDRCPLDVEVLRSAVAGTGWRRVDVVEQTGSTNADLIGRAGAGEDICGAVLLGEFQSAGRGRHGRSWSAPAGSQISMSVG